MFFYFYYFVYEVIFMASIFLITKNYVLKIFSMKDVHIHINIICMFATSCIIDLVASIGVKMDRSVVAVMKSKEEESYTLQKLSVVDCDSNEQVTD